MGPTLLHELNPRLAMTFGLFTMQGLFLLGKKQALGVNINFDGSLLKSPEDLAIIGCEEH
ncbi:hypothetical protein [Streptococcus pyogenes]|uniref:hypothetical protein n=1 Tax=Streptococcus pyogenes TaxID=1314 RepID=UPI001D1311C1|nr:hypothetical protein [Streptococcus pyogenes]